MARPVPLAWSNLAHDRVRFALFAAGIGFAVVLMGVQLGIMNALLDGNTLLLQALDADLVLVSPGRPALLFPDGFSRRRLDQARAVDGVLSAHPVYLEYQVGEVRHAADDPAGRGPNRRLRVVGVDPAAGVLDLPGLDPGAWERLQTPGTGLFDRRSRPAADPRSPGETVFGPLAAGGTTELAGRRVALVGGFDLGFDFSTEGTLVVSDRTFGEYLREPFAPSAPLADVSLGAVRVRPGADVEAVRDRVQEVVGRDGDVLVLTKAEMVARERAFWSANTPIGFAFGAGVVLGFVVGVVICYQILSADVADHRPEYATLRAIGYPNAYLSRVVMEESLILAFAGLVPGLLVTVGAYRLLAELTGLPVRLTPGRVGLVAGLTVAMCLASGLLAVRQVKAADPADVF
ncbi:MAG: FtsX-like permease family protein [Gemmataceae bacterium]|nr:FtsX-like permease family protein [Gemmataceae bacterium]